MEDNHIVDLFWARAEQAIAETSAKYGTYLSNISRNILSDPADAEECVNDTYLDAWNSMPPHRPTRLSAFLGKITRRISIDRWRRSSAQKRGGGQLPLALDELAECVHHGDSVEDEVQRQLLVQSIHRFLRSLSPTERRVFLCRYWYLDPIQDIARQFSFSPSKVTSMLHRTRAKLRVHLEQEGW